MLLLALIFIVVPIIEIYVIIQVGQAIGPWWTILLLIVDSIIGARLLRWQGGRAWVNFQNAMAAGRIPHREILDGVLIIAGGAFLLTPGFVTDAFGLLLLIPPTRAAIRRFVVAMLTRRSGARFARVVVRRVPGRSGPPPPHRDADRHRAPPPAAPMIGPGDERARDDGAGFHDSVLVEFCDGEREIFGLLRMARVPDAGRTDLLAVMFSGSEAVLSEAQQGLTPVGGWERAQAGPARLEVVAPLERWRAGYDGPAAGFDLELTAVSAPVDFDAPPAAELARASGTHGYEQLCTVRGTASVNGQQTHIEGVGRRVHSWGRSEPGAISAARSVFAFAEGSGMTVAAIRPAGTSDHGHELIAGHLLRSAVEPLALEQVRLSTVYDRSGRPREAGLELLAPGEEYPRRVAGEATCGISIESEDAVTWLAFFRWSFEGVPGLGSYQLHRRR